MNKKDMYWFVVVFITWVFLASAVGCVSTEQVKRERHGNQGQE
jgi:hypothetical protein